MSEEIPLHKRTVMSSVQPKQQHKTKTSFTGQPTQQQKATPKSSSTNPPPQQQKTVLKGTSSKKPTQQTSSQVPSASRSQQKRNYRPKLQTTTPETSSAGQPTQQKATPKSSSTNHPRQQRKTKGSRTKKPRHQQPSTDRPPQPEEILSLSKDWDSEWPKLQATVSEAKTFSHDQPTQQRKTSTSKQRPKQNKTSPGVHQTKEQETETGNQSSSGRSRSSKCSRGWVNFHLHAVSSALTVLSTLRSNHAVCIPIGICTLGVRGDTCVVKGRYRYYGSHRDRDRDRRNVNICEWDEDGDIYNRIKSSKKLTNSTSTGEISSRRTNRNKNKIKKQKQDTVRTLRCSLLLCEDNDMGCFFDDD